MLHPVGSHSPSVYWRRRFALLGAVLTLIVLSAWVLRPRSGAHHNAAPGSGRHTAASNAALATSAAPSTATANSSTRPTTHLAAGATGSSSSSTGVPKTAASSCTAAQLKVAAVAGSSAYHVGDQPELLLQVGNNGSTPCVQDLADRQVELRVYNGESRVWGSHDCEIQPGTDLRTLAVGQTVRISVIWSGLSSQPECAGTRQRVGAGTYTLYALLSGHTGTAAQFSIS